MASRAAAASPFVFAALAALATPGAAEVRVQVTGASVDLAATAAPLSEVLDRLSRQTGMKVVYEGAAPRQLVTVTVRGRTPAQTVLAVLEGQGINYALVTDPAGATVRTLLVTGAASSSSGGSTPARAAVPPVNRSPFGPPPGAGPASEPAFEEGDEEQPEEPVNFGVPPGVEGVEPQPPAVNLPGQPGTNVPPGQNVPGAYQGPMAPPQQFPVSPFAPQAPAPAPAPVPSQGNTPTPPAPQ